MNFGKSIPLTAETARIEYNAKVRITAQAAWDRWPEANGMRRRLFDLAEIAGIDSEKVCEDLNEAKIDCDGGRW
jgi:hypothetical protein